MVSQAIVLLVAMIVAAIIFAVAKLLGRGINFGTVFKAFALALTMLPMLVMGVVLAFLAELGVFMVVILTLHATGALPDYLPRTYETLALWGMLAVALGYAGFNWWRYVLRYVIHVAREE
jgi:hypothetical protein